jgi:glycosyltransferase involved in cell wall biosynthesis
MDVGASIVIPAYNEESVIENTLTDLRQLKDAELIVVCNGCTDRTFEIVQSLDFSNVICIKIPEKNKGTAIIEGFKHAKFNIIGFTDADGSFETKYIKRLIRGINGADCVIASKWKGRSFFTVNWPLKRKISSRAWNLLVNTLLNLNIDDTQAGAKFMKKSVYDAIDKDFISRGWEMDVELLYKIKKKGYKIKEIYTPVKPIERISTFNMKKAPEMFINLIKIRLGA